MNNQITITRKLEKISALIAEIHVLMAKPEESKPKDRSPKLVSVELILESLPSSSACTRWVTCADFCKELGIKPTRGACTSVGASLKHLGFKSRRSNGKTLVFIPPIIEKF